MGSDIWQLPQLLANEARLTSELTMIKYNSGMQDSVIMTDPDILGGSYPVFRGTRVPVETFFNHLKRGKSIDDFLVGFPTVTREQLLAVIDYAVESVKMRQVA